MCFKLGFFGEGVSVEPNQIFHDILVLYDDPTIVHQQLRHGVPLFLGFHSTQEEGEGESPSVAHLISDWRLPLEASRISRPLNCKVMVV